VNLGLAGKRFVIAGAASALGKATSTLLAREGAGLLLLGRNRDKLEALAADLDGPVEPTLGTLDLQSDPDALARPIREDAVVAGPFSGGVYCPGTGPMAPLRMLNSDAIEKLMRINFVAAQMFAKALAAKKIRHPDGGSIVLVASAAGSRGNKGLSTYSASKAALISSARSFALELAEWRIRVNCVSPGYFESPLAESSFSWHPGGREALEKQHPLGVGTPDDVAGAVVFLLSDLARWITGTNLIVDGGYLA